jgi:hypothetical protein
VAVPAEHGFNGMGELGIIILVNTTSINPEVFQVILPSLLSAEFNLTEADFFSARVVH